MMLHFELESHNTVLWFVPVVLQCQIFRVPTFLLELEWPEVSFQYFLLCPRGLFKLVDFSQTGSVQSVAILTKTLTIQHGKRLSISYDKLPNSVPVDELESLVTLLESHTMSNFLIRNSDVTFNSVLQDATHPILTTILYVNNKCYNS